MACQQLSFGFWKSLDFWSLASRYFTCSLVSVHPQAPDDFHLQLLWKASVNMAGKDPLETRAFSSFGYTSNGMPESHNNSIFNLMGGLWLWSFPLSGCYQPKINTRRMLMISQNSVPAGNTVQRTADLGEILPASWVMTDSFLRLPSCHVGLADPLSYLGSVWASELCLLSRVKTWRLSSGYQKTRGFP